jgi:hypothetical protein
MKKIVAPLKWIALRAGIVLVAAGLLGVWLAPAAKWNRLIRPYYQEALQIIDRADKVYREGSQPDPTLDVAADASVLADELIWNIGPVPSCAYTGVLQIRTALDIIERAFFDVGMGQYRELMLRLARGHLDNAALEAFCP